MFPGCSEEISSSRLACKMHWFRVSETVRAQIRMLMTHGDHDAARVLLSDAFAQLKGSI